MMTTIAMMRWRRGIQWRTSDVMLSGAGCVLVPLSAVSRTLVEYFRRGIERWVVVVRTLVARRSGRCWGAALTPLGRLRHQGASSRT